MNEYVLAGLSFVAGGMATSWALLVVAISRRHEPIVRATCKAIGDSGHRCTRPAGHTGPHRGE